MDNVEDALEASEEIGRKYAPDSCPGHPISASMEEVCSLLGMQVEAVWQLVT